ncbi:MAG: hypothetical protein WD010_08325 [Nitriliruptor sp.]|uniref:hypothetical protein n=1 Tax=Nitriliruptor sp. TaxID=2448056 RepID=UPI0034A039A9
MTTTDAATTDRADRVAERLAGPVLVAALASIPATFLTLLEGGWNTTGQVLNTASGVVLVAETVVLLVVADDKRAWLRNNLWLVGLTIAVVVAVVLAVGPVQLLRLVRTVGALRIIRVRRIFRAGGVVRERWGHDARWEKLATGAVSLVVAAFVAVVLADPTSQTRQFLEGATGPLGVWAVLLAGAIVAVATYVVRANREP